MSRAPRHLLIALGAAALAYAAGTVAYASVYQRYEAWKFEQPVAAVASATGATEPLAADVRDGDIIGKLEIPRIGLSVMVFQGTTSHTLLVGAGHIPGTALPGADGNVAIAAHRDTFFRGLKGIGPGEAIRITTRLRTYDYVVGSTSIVDPEDLQVLAPGDRSELTLVTCFPFYWLGAAPKRFIVHALLQTSGGTPIGPSLTAGLSNQ